MGFSTVGVLKEDKERLKKLAKEHGMNEYRFIRYLLDIYDKLNTIKFYLGYDSIEEVFAFIEDALPKSRYEMVIRETNKYLERLSKLGFPEMLQAELADTIHAILRKNARKIDYAMGGRF